MAKAVVVGADVVVVVGSKMIKKIISCGIFEEPILNVSVS